ncbi:MAG TPA: DUF1801 domain-containing protein [Dokdonella sp.]|uniref:DUF1801 domain-containing protein n=1 Tax=Dokdonella sp. TaxID=2291710 RepID=UPI002D7E6774|nr:DUF1801 domain-containing protein [Dokdonella sp.]HET9034208.1 DUF1801 domain-containing protein [Dokdonella sp.]
MASSKATRVEDYLQELSTERREVIASVRDLINRHLPDGYVETMASGMISWVIPLSRYPVTYNKQPLPYVALAAQKNNYALYLMGAYMNAEDDGSLREAYKTAGKRLDMGKSCLRFRHREDLLDEAIERLIASTPVDETIRRYEASRTRT